MKKIVISLVCLLFVVCGVSVSAVLLSSYGSSITNPADDETKANYDIEFKVIIVKHGMNIGSYDTLISPANIGENYGECSITITDVDNASNKQTSTTSVSLNFDNQITLTETHSESYEFAGWFEVDSYDYDADGSGYINVYKQSSSSTYTMMDDFSRGCAIFKERGTNSAKITYYGGSDRQTNQTTLKISYSIGSVNKSVTLSNGGSYTITAVWRQTVKISVNVTPTGLPRKRYLMKFSKDPSYVSGSLGVTIGNASQAMSMNWWASGDKTIDVYVRQLYDLTFDTGDDTVTEYKLHGRDYTLPSLSGYSRTGYTATKWKSGSTEYSPGATYTANASATFIPNWTPIQYSVTTYFDYPDGFGNYIDMEYDQTLALYVLPDETNRNFKGWLFEGMDSSVHQIGDVQTSATSYFWSADNGVDVSGGLTGKGVYYKNLTSVAGSEIIVIAQWEVTTYNFNINFLMPDESEPVSTGEAGKATITYSDTGETVVAWNERENDKLNVGQTITISNIIPGAGLAVESVSCTGFTQSSSGNTYTFTMGAQAGTITIKMRWDNSANLRLNWKALNMSETETLNNVGGSVELTRKLGQGSGISDVASTYTSTITAERSISDKTFTIKAIPSENYIFMGFTTTDAKPTEASQTFTYTGTDDVLYVWFKQVSNFKLKFDQAEGYYYYEDGLFPQTYAGDALSKTLDNATGASSTTFSYDLGTPWEAMEFDGRGGGVYTLGRQYMYTDQLTVTLWGYMENWADYAAGNTGNGNMRLISCTEAGGFNIEANNGYIQFMAFDAGANEYKHIKANSWTSLGKNSWHMFTMTFDGSNMRVYVDGSFFGSIAFTGQIKYSNSNNIFIGAEAGSHLRLPDGHFFKGKIKKVNVLNMCLASNQVQSLYNNGAEKDGVDTNNVEMKVLSYNGSQYAQAAVGRWYKLEPIRWRINENLFLGYGASTVQNISAVTADIIGFGAIAGGPVQGGWNFMQSSAYANFNHQLLGLNNTVAREFTNDYYTVEGSFPPTGSQAVMFDAGKARYASAWEIETVITGTKAAKISDMAAFITSGGVRKTGGMYANYITRSLYPQRNVAYMYTKNGDGGQAFLQQCLGARLSLTLKDLFWDGES